MDMQDWPDLSNHIVICIESLDLAQAAQQDAAIQGIFVMYNFLPQFCQSAQDQCTDAVAKVQGAMQYDCAVVRQSSQTYNLCSRILCWCDKAHQKGSTDDIVLWYVLASIVQ